METTFSVFSRTNSGIEYPVKNFLGSKKSADNWIKEHNYDEVRTPYYSPEGSLTFLKYLNGLFVKEIEGMLQCNRTGLTTEGKDIYGQLLFPWESNEDAVIRINATPHNNFQLVQLY